MNALRELQLIANTVPIHLNYLNTDEVFVFVNQAAASWWQLAPEEMMGKSIKDLMPADRYLEVKPYLDRVLRGEQVVHESIFMREDGTEGYFLNTYTPDIDERGSVLGFVATGTDISDRRRFILETAKRERDFRILADSMPQIVWTATPDGHVDYYNQRWYDFTGLPRGSADNTLWAQILHPDDSETLHTTWSKALRSGEPYETEFRILNAFTGEYRWHLSRARPVKDKQGRPLKWYGSNTDIHDYKLILQNLESETELRDRFVSTLSHDLRTPLTIAKISAQMLLKKAPEASDAKLLHMIEENMNRADQMIQDLLDVNLLKAGQKLPLRMSKCELNVLAAKVIDQFSHIHGERFLLKSNEHLEAEVDCDGFRRILENLLNNAVKYGAPEGAISVRLEKYASMAELKVHNSGPHIPPEVLPFLFDGFTRSDSARQGPHKGWGIGLSLVKGIATAHGGEAIVESSASKGTTFTVRLPLFH